MNKQINFLVGLPRAGNTIFSSILNQNPKVAVTANSITNEIAKELIKLTKGEVFANFPYAEPFENVCKSAEEYKTELIKHSKKYRNYEI